MTRVLVVEDDRILRRAAEAMLAQAGFAVTTAEDGEEGLRLARELRPDIVLLDLLMPKLSGVEVLRALKADPATAGIPVMILSNSSREDYKRDALALGATEYHLKSNLSLKDLVARVAHVAGGADAGPNRPVDPAGLTERLGGDARLAAETLAGYRSDMPERMARLREAVAARDALSVEHAAHRVHGALRLIGATEAADLAQRIELAGEARALAGVDTLVEALACEVARIAAALDTESPERRA